jgi:acetyl esterase
MLDVQAQALIDLMNSRGAPPVHTLTPAEARRYYLERRTFTQPEPPAMAQVQDLTLPEAERTDGGPALAMRLYRPHTANAATNQAPAAEMPPVLVYLHGGGWTIGDLDTHDVLCRQLAHASAGVVVSVDYRLGPEQVFPAAVDDSVAAFQWVRAQAAALGVDAQRMAVGGDSAGGNLAAAVCLALREAGQAQPALQLLIYPATDMRAVAPSHTTNAQGYLLTRDSITYYRGNYLPDAAQWTDWRASPLLAASHAGLAPALVLTAGFDPLRDEGLQYADALSAAGVPTEYICFERQIHGFITMGRVIEEANTAVALCGAVLRRAWTA